MSKVKTVSSLCYYFLLSSLNIYSGGFSVGELVKFCNKYVPIEKISVGDQVVSYNNKNKLGISSIQSIKKRRVNSYVHIVVDDVCIWAACDQKFLANDNLWIEAKKLTSKDVLRDINNSAIPIDGIKIVCDSTVLYVIEAATAHTYCVTKKDIVVHNFAPAVGLGISFLVGSGGFEFAGLTLSAGLLAVGSFFGVKACKKKFRKPTIKVVAQSEIISGSCGGSPQGPKKDDKDKKIQRPLTNKEARRIAKELGYKEDKSPPFNCRNQLTFRKGKDWITPDVDCHKGGVWKRFFGKQRVGTYDLYLSTKIGD